MNLSFWLYDPNLANEAPSFREDQVQIDELLLCNLAQVLLGGSAARELCR
jgi:hypothetical protein